MQKIKSKSIFVSFLLVIAVCFFVCSGFSECEWLNNDSDDKTTTKDINPVSDSTDDKDIEDSASGDKISVVFNAQGGTVSQNSLSVNKGGKISNMPTAHKDGSYFVGWYKESSYVNEFTTSTVVNSAMTVYAKWQTISGTYAALLAEFAINKMKDDAYLLSFQASGSYAQYAFKKEYFTHISYATQSNKYVGTATIDVSTPLFENKTQSFIDLYKKSSEYSTYRSRLSNDVKLIFDKSIEALTTVTIKNDGHITGYSVTGDKIYINSSLSSKPHIMNIKSNKTEEVIKVSDINDTTGYQNIKNALSGYYYFFKASNTSSEDIAGAPQLANNQGRLEFTSK